MSSDPSRLGPEQRTATLDRLDEERFDVVVIGGGVTGMGAALDAATRGLNVAVIEQRDIASGTSSRSSKLIHGGLRYLEQLNVSLVRESLRERSLLLTAIAPHLVRPVPFIYPFRHRAWERFYVGSGVMLYDLLAATGSNPMPRHRHLSKSTMLDLFPALDPEQFVGGVQYFDAGADDARFTVFLARTAARYGASIAPSTRVVGFERSGHRITGVHATCLETGRDLMVSSRVVINATGVWTDKVEELVGDRVRNVTASKGIHLVIPRDRIAAETGLITKTEKSVLFVIPAGSHWLVGTTDTPWDLGLAHPAASSSDIDYLLRHLNSVLVEPVAKEDVVGVYAGLRPLVTGDTASTAKLSREHAITHPAPGMVTIAGGKYTTFRVMAEDVVDAASDEMGGRVPGSVTAEIPLVGASGYHAVWNSRNRLARDAGLETDQVERLLYRYGTAIEDLTALIAVRPELSKPLDGGGPYLAAEAHYAATHEGALHLDDVLTRRTRISIDVPDRGLEAAIPVARLMAEVHGWDDATVERELEHYRARVAAERESQTKPDDHTADATRMGAADVRTAGRTG